MTSPEAQKILTMLATADPMDGYGKQYINKLFYCFKNQVSNDHMVKHIDGKWFDYSTPQVSRISIPDVANSLDAIKAVEDAELEGWRLCIKEDEYLGGFQCNLVYAPKGFAIHDITTCIYLPAETFARLYAVIMALDFKRENGE